MYCVFPCVFDGMGAMETRNENMNGVQQELLRIIQNDDARELIENMVYRMAVIEEAYYRVRELREAVKPYIPENSEHDEEYWMAAYLVKPHASEVIEKLKQLNEIQREIVELDEQVQEIKSKQWTLEDKLGDLDAMQENIADDIDKLVSEDFNRYIGFNRVDLEDLLYESTRQWVAKQLSSKSS